MRRRGLGGGCLSRGTRFDAALLLRLTMFDVLVVFFFSFVSCSFFSPCFVFSSGPYPRCGPFSHYDFTRHDFFTSFSLLFSSSDKAFF